MIPLRRWLVLLLPLVLDACGGAQIIPAGEAPVMRQGESTIVFMRPSALGGVVAASVFDVTGPETKFVGLVNYGTKYAHSVKPGQYTFMVIGESADFMQATVLPDRTYYALVTPRVGVWKARFSFKPIRQHELGGAEFVGWSSATAYVTNSPATVNWAVENAGDINSKRTQYWPEWNAKPPHQRASQTLNAEDGRPSVGVAAPAAAPTAVAAVPAATTTAAAFAASTPLPTSVKVVPPAADVPPSVAAYSGIWVGQWKDGPEHTLVVEQIEGRNVKLVYSWGVGPRGRNPQKPGYVRADGAIDDEGVLRTVLPTGAHVAYRHSGDQRLSGQWQDRTRVFQTVLQKR